MIGPWYTPPKKFTGQRYPTKSWALENGPTFRREKTCRHVGYLFVKFQGTEVEYVSGGRGRHFLAEKKKYPPKPGIWFPQTAPQTAQHQLLLPRTLERVSVPEIPVTPVVSLAMMTFRKGCELRKVVMKLPRLFNPFIDQKGGSSGHFLQAEIFYPPKQSLCLWPSKSSKQ